MTSVNATLAALNQLNPFSTHEVLLTAVSAKIAIEASLLEHGNMLRATYVLSIGLELPNPDMVFRYIAWGSGYLKLSGYSERVLTHLLQEYHGATEATDWFRRVQPGLWYSLRGSERLPRATVLRHPTSGAYVVMQSPESPLPPSADPFIWSGHD